MDRPLKKVDPNEDCGRHSFRFAFARAERNCVRQSRGRGAPGRFAPARVLRRHGGRRCRPRHDRCRTPAPAQARTGGGRSRRGSDSARARTIRPPSAARPPSPRERHAGVGRRGTAVRARLAGVSFRQLRRTLRPVHRTCPAAFPALGGLAPRRSGRPGRGRRASCGAACLPDPPRAPRGRPVYRWVRAARQPVPYRARLPGRARHPRRGGCFRTRDLRGLERRRLGEPRDHCPQRWGHPDPVRAPLARQCESR
jgi:hypothetical protein